MRGNQTNILRLAVIAVVFLSISLRRPSTEFIQESNEIASILSSISLYTSDCENPGDYFNSVEELITISYEGKACEDGTPAVSVLDQTLKGILNSTLVTNKGSRIIYYEMLVYAGENNTKNSLVAPIYTSSQNPRPSTCLGRKLSNFKTFLVSSSPDPIYMRLDICYQK